MGWDSARDSSVERHAFDVRPRVAIAADAPFMATMLAEAAAWREGVRAPVADVIAPTAIGRYVAGWPRQGDGGVVVDGGGAAWWRHFDAAAPGYAFVADDVPEVTIGVVAGQRGRGVGTALLHALAARGRAEGAPALSLSVEADNPAQRLYRRLGFEVVEVAGGALTMLRLLR